MEHYLLLARSITFAQRMQKVLGRAGIRCQIFRAPRELTDRGCAYAVKISGADFSSAMTVIYNEAFYPERVFLFSRGTYQEVTL